MCSGSGINRRRTRRNDGCRGGRGCGGSSRSACDRVICGCNGPLAALLIDSGRGYRRCRRCSSGWLLGPDGRRGSDGRRDKYCARGTGLAGCEVVLHSHNRRGRGRRSCSARRNTTGTGTRKRGFRSNGADRRVSAHRTP